jgi:maleylacetate reductase
MTSDDLDKAAQIAVQNPYWNPRPIGTDSAAALRNLLQNAWEGASPVAS